MCILTEGHRLQLMQDDPHSHVSEGCTCMAAWGVNADGAKSTMFLALALSHSADSHGSVL